MLTKNIVLIGMPSTGKSTIGKELSKKFKVEFVDTDYLIKKEENMELKAIVIEKGLETFLKIQEETILKVDVDKCRIISTGGSVVYSTLAMKHLKRNSIVVYLNTSKNILKQRLLEGRRFAKEKDKSFDELYDERVPLYKKYSDFEIKCDGKNVEEVSKIVVNKLQKHYKFNLNVFI